MVGSEVLGPALAAVVTAGFAALTLAGRPHRSMNQFLAFFLLLIAGNQGANVMRLLATTDAARVFWFRIASAFAFLDPFVLYYFASLFPERNHLNDAWKVALVGAGSLALLATTPFYLPQRLAGPEMMVLRRGWRAYTAIVYAVVFLHVARPLWQGKATSAHRFAYPALSIAAVRAVSRLMDRAEKFAYKVGGLDPGPLAQALLNELTLLAAVLATGTGVLVALRRAVPENRKLLAGGLLFAGGLTIASSLSREIRTLKGLGLVGAVPREIVRLDAMSDGVVWFVFGVLVSAAILHERILDLSMRTRRGVGRVVGAAAFVGCLVIAVGVIGPSRSIGGGVTVAHLALVAGLLVFTRWFHELVDRGAAKVYRVPGSNGVASAIQTYKAGVRQTVAEDRPIRTDPELERLRRELELDPQTARTVERMVAGSYEGPVTAGALVDGRYRVLEMVGRGGFGRTFLADDRLLDRRVVIKEVLHEQASSSADAIREARSAASVDHPNVVTIHDVLHRGASSLIVMEHVDGPTLAERLDDGHPLPAPVVGSLGEKVLAGLEAIHDEGVIHRDLKPANVLLDDGEPKITDFGVATDRRRDTLAPGERGDPVGTPGYRAPEQRAGAEPDPRCDGFAVGRILEEAAGDDVPDAVREVIEQATSQAPGERFPSAAAMREALEAARTLAPEGEDRPTGSDEVAGS